MMVLGETKVRRVHRGGGGYTHEPKFDDTWSELMQLRWSAAVSSIDIAPLRIEVTSGVGGSSTNGVTNEDYAFYVSVPGSGFGAGPKTFWQAWSYITDLSTGILMERYHAERIAAAAESTPIFDRLVVRFAIERGHAG